MISVRFVYNDGKDLKVNIPTEQFQQLFASLNQKQVYWDSAVKQGFWTDLDRIRFMEFEVKEEENDTNAKTISQESCGGAQCESSSSGEDSARIESEPSIA